MRRYDNGKLPIAAEMALRGDAREEGVSALLIACQTDTANSYWERWYSSHDVCLSPLGQEREAVRRAITLPRRHRGRGRNHQGFAPGYDSRTHGQTWDGSCYGLHAQW